MFKKTASTVYVSAPAAAQILFDFRRLVTPTGHTQFATTFGPGWQESLEQARLGKQVGRFVTKLADVGGVERVVVGPKGVQISYCPTANVFGPATAALQEAFDTATTVVFDPPIPLRRPAEPPYAHLGI